jgi:uncharacterized protein (TIGR00255 family)
MLKSMTAYGRAVQKCEDRDVTVEIRSVNSRYFDCTVRLPRGYLHMEEKIKSFVQKNVISRGKVEIFINVEKHSAGVAQVSVDMEYARAYVDALRRLRDELGLKDDITVMSVAKSPDVFSVSHVEEDPEEEWARMEEVLSRAGQDFSAMREGEGERIARDISEKVGKVALWREEIAALSKNDTEGYRQKLEGRLRNLLDERGIAVDEGRLLTECAIFADRIAIDEELVRLGSHFEAFDRMLSASEPTGKKLDFLMQEMNRETNTIGSKCQNTEVAERVVLIKNELEKIREQIQNVE